MQEMNKLAYAVIMTIVTILTLATALLISGCSMKLYPVRNPDEQIEILRRVAIDSYKDGMFDVLDAVSEEPKPSDELFGM